MEYIFCNSITGVSRSRRAVIIIIIIIIIGKLKFSILLSSESGENKRISFGKRLPFNFFKNTICFEEGRFGFEILYLLLFV